MNWHCISLNILEKRTSKNELYSNCCVVVEIVKQIDITLFNFKVDWKIQLNKFDKSQLSKIVQKNFLNNLKIETRLKSSLK